MSAVLAEVAQYPAAKWELRPLAEVADILDSHRVPVNAKERETRQGTVPYYGATGQVGWIDEHIFDEELVLLGEDGAPFLESNKAKAYVIRGKTWVNNHAHVLRARAVPTRWLAHHLNSISYAGLVTGTTRLKLTQAAMRQIHVPVASWHVMETVVAEIEKQFSRLDEAVANLKRVKANLKRYKATVLKTAVEGHLVPIEPGTHSWTRATLGGIAQIVGGLTKNPKRAKIAVQLPYLRVANVYANELRLEKIERIGVADSELGKLLLKAGDLLIVEGNGSKDQIGRLALWDGSIDPCVHQNHLIRVRATGAAAPKWILFWLLSPQGRGHIEEVSSSTSGLYTLSVGKVAALPVVLPPLVEQQRLVAEIERHLSIIEELENSVATAFRRAERLKQATLRAHLFSH